MIIAGVRVATVISIGLATIAAAIGAGGLGEYIFRGLAMVNNQVILAGAIPGRRPGDPGRRKPGMAGETPALRHAATERSVVILSAAKDPCI